MTVVHLPAPRTDDEEMEEDSLARSRVERGRKELTRTADLASSLSPQLNPHSTPDMVSTMLVCMLSPADETRVCQSSDGEDYAGGDTDYEDDEMDDALFDQPDAAIPARNPVAQPYAQAAYNPPAAAMGQNDMFQAARYLNPGAFQAGFGGHAFARPPASAFRRSYK